MHDFFGMLNKWVDLKLFLEHLLCARYYIGYGDKDEMRGLCPQGAYSLLSKMLHEQKYSIGITKCHRKTQLPLAIETWEDDAKCRELHLNWDLLKQNLSCTYVIY